MIVHWSEAFRSFLMLTPRSNWASACWSTCPFMLFIPSTCLHNCTFVNIKLHMPSGGPIMKPAEVPLHGISSYVISDYLCHTAWCYSIRIATILTNCVLIDILQHTIFSKPICVLWLTIIGLHFGSRSLLCQKVTRVHCCIFDPPCIVNAYRTTRRQTNSRSVKSRTG